MSNYYSVLGTYPGASEEAIKKAYLRKIKELHPDKFDDPKEKEKATNEFTLINEAYKILSDPIKREEYDKKLTTSPEQENIKKAKDAKRSYNLGLSQLEEKPYFALEHLQTAFGLDPKPLYQSYYGLCLVITYKHDEGFTHLKEAVDKFPGDAHLHYNLGLAYMIKKETNEARRCFEQTLKWDPNFKKAEDMLKKLPAEKGPPPKATKQEKTAESAKKVGKGLKKSLPVWLIPLIIGAGLLLIILAILFMDRYSKYKYRTSGIKLGKIKFKAVDPNNEFSDLYAYFDLNDDNFLELIKQKAEDESSQFQILDGKANKEIFSEKACSLNVSIQKTNGYRDIVVSYKNGNKKFIWDGNKYITK